MIFFGGGGGLLLKWWSLFCHNTLSPFRYCNGEILEEWPCSWTAAHTAPMWRTHIGYSHPLHIRQFYLLPVTVRLRLYTFQPENCTLSINYIIVVTPVHWKKQQITVTIWQNLKVINALKSMNLEHVTPTEVETERWASLFVNQQLRHPFFKPVMFNSEVFLHSSSPSSGSYCFF